MANIDLQTGVFPITQLPLDAKLYAITKAELTVLGMNDLKAYYYYDGMIVFCVEDQLRYQWREEATVGETGGLVGTSFLYPANAIANGIDYSGKTFNLFLYQITAAEVSDFQTNVSLNVDVVRNTSYVNIRLDEDVMLDGDAVLVDPVTREFWVRADSYIINNTPYVATAAQHFLDPFPGVGDKRIDLFFSDINGAVGVIKGPEAPIAVKPTLNPDTQIEITFATLDENGFTNLTEKLVYDENVGTPNEYAVTESTAGARFNLASTNDPQSNAVSIEATNPIDLDLLTFTPLNLVTTIGISSLYMRIKLKEAAKAVLRIRFYNGTTLVSNIRLRLSTLDGFDIDNTTDHQIVNVTSSRLGFSDLEFTHFTIQVHALGALTTFAGLFLDRIRLISGADGSGGFGDGTWIGLRDTFETDYVGKAKYSPIVLENELGQVLRREILFEDIVGPNAGIRTGVEHITGRTYRVFGSLYRIDNITHNTFVEGFVTLDEPDITFDRYDLFIILNGTGSKGTLSLDSGSGDPVDEVTVNGVIITSGSTAWDTDLATTATRTAENINSFNSSPNYWAKATAGVLDVTAYNPGIGSDGFVIGVTTLLGTSVTPLAGGSDVNSVGFVKGDAIADPAEPNIDFASQVKVGFKRLTANEALQPPEIITHVVYDENLGEPNEWTNQSIHTGGSITDVTDPFQGSLSINIPALATGILEWQNDIHIPYDANGSMLFAIKTTSPWAGGAQGGPNATASLMKIGIFNTPQTLGSTLNVHVALLELFGFDNNSTEWQQIQLPMNLWNFNIGGSGVSEFDTLKFAFLRTPEFQLDFIRFQTGITADGSGPVPEYRLSAVVGNKFSLTRNGIPVPEEITLISSTGLEAIDEGNGIGWRLIGRDPLDYGNIGLNAIDFSLSSGASTTRGALGEKSVVFGLDNEVPSIDTFVYGDRNVLNSGAGFNYLFGFDHVVNNGAGQSFLNFITGQSHVVIGFASAVFGFENTLSGAPNDAAYSFVCGRANEQLGYSLNFLGTGLKGEGSYTTVIGMGNVDFTEQNTGASATQRRLFVIGNGIVDGSGNRTTPSDAFRVWKDGQVDAVSITNPKIDAWGTDTILISRGYADANYLRANLQTEFSTSIVAISGHANRLLIFESAIARTYTINDPLVNGDVVEFTNVGTANLTFIEGSGTLNAPEGFVLLPNRICSLVKRISNGEYYLFGELS